MTSTTLPTMAFTPTAAAFEGIRLLRREPVAVVAWMLIWMAAIMFAAIVVAMGGRVSLPSPGADQSLPDIVGRFGPFAAVFIALFLLVWAITTVAAYRAVLRPQDRRFFYLRLGADEVRLAIMTASSFVLLGLFGVVPAYLLLVLANPLMSAVPALARNIATLGALTTVCLDVWLGVRLSLISVETFAERRFHLSAYWPLTKGRFWYLFACYFLCFLAVFALSLLLSVVLGIITAVAQPDLGPGTILRRTSLLALAGVMGIFFAGFSVLSSTIFCACQAYAFRAIVGDGKAGVAIA